MSPDLPTALPLWRQFAAAWMLSVRRLARSKFMLGNLILVSLPLGLGLLIGLRASFTHPAPFTRAYEAILRTLFLHVVVFYSASIVGFAVVRQDSDDRTLHYLYLQPVRRWVVWLGKMSACLTLSAATCLASLWLSYLAIVLTGAGLRETVAQVFGDGRWVILMQQSLVVVLGLSVYATFAMAMGSIFKSATYTVLLLFWESALPYLPSALKYWTASHYLQSLLPGRLIAERRLFELLGELSPPLLSVGVLVGLSLVFGAVALTLFHFRQCHYKEG